MSHIQLIIHLIMKLSSAADALNSNDVNPKRRKHSHKEQVMKIVHKNDTEVYAAYWQDDDKRRVDEPSFYQGKVVATREINNHAQILREYDVIFDNNNTITAIPESMVYLVKEYELRMQYEYDNDDNLPWHGKVLFHVDETSSDDWYKYTGWFSICINNNRIHFPSLLLALEAYDKNIMDNLGEVSQLNLTDPSVTNDTILLPPPVRSPKIDYHGPQFRVVSMVGKGQEGPCYITSTKSCCGNRLRAVYHNGDIDANANKQTITRDRRCTSKKINKHETHLFNIANNEDMKPYPKSVILNNKYSVFCDGGKDEDSAFNVPNLSKPVRVISIRDGHLVILEPPHNKGLGYCIPNHSSDIILPPINITKSRFATKTKNVHSLITALNDITKWYQASFHRSDSKSVARDMNLEGKDSYYICVGTTAKQSGGVSLYNAAFANSKPESQQRMLKLIKSIEFLWFEWVERRHLKIILDGIEMTDAKTFTLPYDTSRSSQVYGAFASGK